jgi:5-methylcytosine-specific restriction endonuclease McrA
MAGRRRSWNDQQLRDAVRTSYGMAEMLRTLGLRAAGGNYVPFRRRIREMGLSTDHWTGQGHLKGKTNPHVPKRPLKEILRRNSNYQSNKLRTRLLREGLLYAQCSECKLDKWRDNPIPLELDHIDGDVHNNLLRNLRLLCPNCHALTSTYRGRNTRYSHIPPIAEINNGIQKLRSISAYACARGVSPETVRGWLRSERLKRLEERGR